MRSRTLRNRARAGGGEAAHDRTRRERSAHGSPVAPLRVRQLRHHGRRVAGVPRWAARLQRPSTTRGRPYATSRSSLSSWSGCSASRSWSGSRSGRRHGMRRCAWSPSPCLPRATSSCSFRGGRTRRERTAPLPRSAAPSYFETRVPTRSPTARWRHSEGCRYACGGDQPGDHGVRVPHLARLQLVTTPHRVGTVVTSSRTFVLHTWKYIDASLAALTDRLADTHGTIKGL
jgi:hypothetical protein